MEKVISTLSIQQGVVEQANGKVVSPVELVPKDMPDGICMDE